MAVNHGYGKIAGAKSLVFAYDTKDTKNSYKGPPTQNYAHVNVANCSSTAGWSGTSVHTQYGLSRTLGVEKDGRTTFHVTYTPNATAGDCYHTFTLQDVNGNNVQTNGGEVFYLTFEWKSEGAEYLISGGDNWSTSTFYGDGWKLGTHMSAQDFGSVPIGNGWYRRTIKYTAAAVTGQTPLMRFSSGYKQTSGGDYNIWVANIAMTANHPPLNWLPGQSSRSSTQGLRDLTGNSTIDITNTSFDENATKSFDGTNDYIDSGFDLSWNHTNQVSVELLLKPDTITGGNYGIIGKEYPNWEWAFYQNNQTIKLVYWNSSGGHTNGMDFTATAFSAANKWYHVVYTWDGSTSKFYINGELGNSHTATDPTINQNRSNNVMIGGHTYVWGDMYWPGEIAVTKFYNRDLTVSEVRKNYSNYKSKFNL